MELQFLYDTFRFIANTNLQLMELILEAAFHLKKRQKIPKDIENSHFEEQLTMPSQIKKKQRNLQTNKSTKHIETKRNSIKNSGLTLVLRKCKQFLLQI